jgi:ACR3 family arsenite transporter
MCLGFLPNNFFPARIFMGDTGSMTLGLLLAAAGMRVLLLLGVGWVIGLKAELFEVWGRSFSGKSLILLAGAPCTAMVFVWSRLTNGDGLFTLSQVALNDIIMVFAFAPIVALLLGISSIVVPWETLTTSVVLYIVVPVLLAQGWRYWLLKQGTEVFNAIMEKIGSWSITALLLTLVLLFGFQGKAIIDQPLIIGLLAVPILIQVFFNAALAYCLNKKLGESHSIACPSALIGASNFFELAVAAAISLFGFQSGAALATVVGVLIEVPVMLIVVRIVNQSKNWYEST